MLVYNSKCQSVLGHILVGVGVGYLVYFSFISVPPIFTSVACSRNWSTIQNVSQSLGIFLWGYLVGGWTGLLLGTYKGGLSTWRPVTVSCSWALGYPFLWGLGWGDLVGDWSGWTPHHNVGSKYIFGLFTLKIRVTCREGKWGLLGKNIGDTYSFGVVMWSDVSKKTWVLYPRHEIFVRSL